VRGRAKVPSGASTGTHEAVELRDGDPARYGGKGVLRAVRNVREEIAPLLAGQDACDQGTIDRRMIEADGTPDKGRLGANAILAVSCAAARSAATSRGIPLWQHLRGGREARMPVPMTNIISGGHHAGHNFEFQDFLVIPRNFADFRDSLEAIVRVHRITRQVIENRGFPLTGVADEGGWGPRLPTNRLALEILTEAIEKAGFVPGAQMAIALDVASTHFYRESKYYLDSEGRVLSSSEMIGLLSEWTADFPIVSVEDALAEDDWEGWVELTRELGGRIQLVGDDLFVTNEARVSRGIAEGAANAVLVKMNQIGTLTETFRVVDQARAAGYTAVISARSGETEDDFLADLAVASGAGQIKIGSVRCSERLSKYNRLLEIAASF
jgi:enolase